MMKKITTICLLALAGMVFANNVHAQQKGAAIVFGKTVHDFGTMLESDGLATCTFEFTNTGDQPLVINNVAPSCGCTTPGWTKEPIAPGGKGNVQATYNPAGRVAPFDKILTVTTNGTPAKIVLHIKGVVLPKPIDFKVTYPVAIGKLRLKKTDAVVGMVSNNASSVHSIEIANAEESPISISFDKVPDYIKVSAEPSTLQPKQQGLIKITFDGSKRADFGFVKNQIVVKEGAKQGVINVSAIVEQKLAKAANDEIANQAPRVSMKDKTFKFDKVAKNKVVTATYDITNEGKTDLIIYNVTSGNTGLKSSVKNLKIKAGKTASIKLSYTPTEQGANNCTAYVATNAPGNTLFEINMVGTVI